MPCHCLVRYGIENIPFRWLKTRFLPSSPSAELVQRGAIRAQTRHIDRHRRMERRPIANKPETCKATDSKCTTQHITDRTPCARSHNPAHLIPRALGLARPLGRPRPVPPLPLDEAPPLVGGGSRDSRVLGFENFFGVGLEEVAVGGGFSTKEVSVVLEGREKKG